MGVCFKSVKFRFIFVIGFLCTLILVGVTSVFVYYPISQAASAISIPESNRINRHPSAVQFSSADITKISDDTQFGSTNASENLDLEKIRHQHNFLARNVPVDSDSEIQGSNFSNRVENRLMHFDFKGAPPAVSFIKETIRLAKEAGITGVLVEWEDTFPWSDDLQNLTMIKGGYSLSDTIEVIEFIESKGLEVIPLIQTFGHVEFILKTEEFEDLRELEGDPQSFCPSQSKTLQIIEEMIKQTVAIHSNSRFIHIGCDEVFTLRLCPLCTSNSESKDELFIRHVIAVAKLVRKFGKIPIIWDDMLRSIPYERLVESNIGTLAEVMIWVYAEEVDRYVGFDSWEKYSKIFPTIWVAGAYKGSSGESTQLPVVSRHIDNTLEWMEAIRRESSKWAFGLGGFVLTGWSRYDHFSVLCELLPAAIPSLIYVSLLVSIPNQDAPPVIRNRIFISDSGDKGKGTQVSQDRNRRSGRRLVPHPQTLLKPKGESSAYIPQFAELTKGHLTPGAVLRNEIVWKEFSRILHCPIRASAYSNVLLESNYTELFVAGKCSWAGVNFFRTLFQLRDLITEARDVQSSIKYKRGWLTEYNIQHRYTLPLRLTELLTAEIPRIKRNLAQKAKSIAIAMKPIYKNEVILEWLEQNIWTPWKELHHLEVIAEDLRGVKYWERRPIRTPVKIISDLGLHPIQLMDKNEL